VFLHKNPHEIIRENPTHSLNNLTDCVEAVRLLGMINLDSMASLEQMDYEIEMSTAFLYYLKVQLIIVNSKLFFYQARSQNILVLFKHSKENLVELIKVMNAYQLLSELVIAKKYNEAQIRAIRALKNLMIEYTNKTIETQPFKDAYDMLKPNIVEMIEECKKVKTKISPEICEFCSEAINENELVCPQQHQIKRCALTNLIIPLDCNNSCSQCFANVTKLDVLMTLFDNATLYFSCPLCDAHLTFSE
jgi:SpoU rRNA methylase family enzyme